MHASACAASGPAVRVAGSSGRRTSAVAPSRPARRPRRAPAPQAVASSLGLAVGASGGVKVAAQVASAAAWGAVAWMGSKLLLEQVRWWWAVWGR